MDVNDVRAEIREPPVDGAPGCDREAKIVPERRGQGPNPRDGDGILDLEACWPVWTRRQDGDGVAAGGKSLGERANQDRRTADPGVIQVGNET
jgi:hypothetical protein